VIIFVDIDNTICFTNNSDYINSQPMYDRIAKINQLYEDGHTIIYWTARGSKSKKNWEELTISQLNSWGCKKHQIIFNKPSYDLFIDDKSISSEIYFNNEITDI